MNKKQLLITTILIAITALILIFPPKALIRNKKVITRMMPFQTRKITGNGIMIQTSYRDPNLSYDWERLAEFIAPALLIGGLLIFFLKDTGRKG